MKVRGIKAFSILAVAALAFAAIAVFATADDSDAIVVYGDDSKTIPIPKVIDASVEELVQGDLKFYVAEDATVKVKKQTRNFTFYVQNGKVLDLDFKVEPASGKKVTIVTVAGDQAFKYTGTSTASSFDGKQAYTSTEFQFEASNGMSLSYEAAKTRYDVRYDGTKFTHSDSIGSGKVIISVDKEFKTNPKIAGGASSSAVYIANGQYLTVESDTDPGFNDIAGLNYGMVIKNITGSKYSYTYYPKGYNAGTVSIDGGNTVFLKEGSVTARADGATVKMNSVAVSGNYMEIKPGSASGSLSLSGGIRSGSMTFSGLIDLGTQKFTVGSGTTLTISDNAAFVDNTILEVNGTLIVQTGLVGHTELGEKDLTVIGSKSGTIVLENLNLWAGYPVSGTIIKLTDGTNTFAGIVDTSAISETARVKGGIATGMINIDQVFILVDDTNVTESFTVNGTLIINQGVNLTIEDNARFTQSGQFSRVINNGQITVKAGTATDSGLFVNDGQFINNGTINFYAKSYSDRSAPTFGVYATVKEFVNKGVMNISKNDTVSLSGFTNSGTMTFGGKVTQPTTIGNSGKLILNGAEVCVSGTDDVYKGLIIDMKGGSVQVQSVKMIGENKLWMKTGTNSGVTLSAELTGTAPAFTVRNVTFSGSGSVDMQGNIAYSLENGSTGTVTMRIEGSSSVKGQFTTPKDLVMAFGNIAKTPQTKATLSVSGTLTISKDTRVSPTDNGSRLSMTVTGRAVDYNSVLSGCNYTAAVYITADSVVYTNLETAITEAYEAGILSVETGTTILTKDLTIPAGMSIQGRSDNVTITIGSSSARPVITISEAASLDVKEILLKNGTLFVENSYDIDEQIVSADVKKESDYSVTFQSLSVALDEAQSGDYIALTGYYVLKDSRMTIPEGVTLDVTANGGIFAAIGSNLTINGTLIVGDFYFIAENEDTISITVNGYLKDEGTVQTADRWYTPVGISYYETTLDPRGEEVTYFVITSLDNIQEAIDSADESKINVEGEAVLGDLTVKGTEEEPAEVTFKKDIKAGTITLDNATAVALPGKSIDATFANEKGSIVISGAYADRKDVRIYSMGDEGVFMNGPVTDSAAGNYSIQFNGLTGMNDATIGWGNCNADPRYPAIEFLGDTTVTGKKNHIENTVADEPTSNNAGTVSVMGSLTVGNASKLTVISDIEALGTLAALEKDDQAAAGSLYVEGNIFLGIAKDDVFSESALLDHYDSPAGAYAYYGKGYTTPQLADSAVLAGNVIVSDDRYITAVPSSTIDGTIIEDMGFLDIFGEDASWLTVYGSGKFNMDGLIPVFINCNVTKIIDDRGKEVAKYDNMNKVVYESDSLDLREVDFVRFVLDYNIYAVMIKTDASIKAVYIDGILAYTGFSENKFYMRNVIAGTHTVSVEPVSGYNADNAYLYDENGTILPGMEFTFGGDDCVEVEGLGETVIYNVAGTEVNPVPPEPSPEQKSEWTITTILLCIIVLIIAFMAVIIVLRLNRS